MKKKIFIVALVVCIMAISIASASIAYFTDIESATNTFTSGNVDIKLYEINDDGDETLITDMANSLVYENKYPGQTVEKNPTIKNVANDAAYVAGIITLGSGDSADITTLLTDDDAVKAFLAGGVLNAANGYNTKIVRDTAAKTITIYIIATDAIAKDGAVVLFENVVIPAKWDSTQMAKFANLTIGVKAYAVQTAGFEADTANGLTAAEVAIKAAFGGGENANGNSDFAPYFAA